MKRSEMRIGMVSAEKHCGVHLQRLAELNYNVTLLGDTPSSIPPSINVLIVRVESCSHGGTATANEWRRSTKKPCIFESGMSGMLRELKKLEDETVTETKFNRRPFSDVKSVFGDKYNEPPFNAAYHICTKYLDITTSEQIRTLREAYHADDFSVFQDVNNKLGGVLLSSQIAYTVFSVMVLYGPDVPARKSKIKSFFQKIRSVQYNTQMVDVVCYWLNLKPPEVIRPAYNRVLPILISPTESTQDGKAPETNPAPDPDIEPTPPLDAPPAALPATPPATPPAAPPAAPLSAPETQLQTLIDDNALQILACMEQLGEMRAQIKALTAKIEEMKVTPASVEPQPVPTVDSLTGAKNAIRRHLRALGIIGPITLRIEE